MIEMPIMQQTIAPYYGGKASHAKTLLPLLQSIPHTIYVEAFGGMAGLLLQKPPVKVEVYNDTDKALVTLFRIIRDYPQQLIDAIEYTPYARDEYYDCLARLRSGECEDLELARITYCILCMSFNGSLNKSGFSNAGAVYSGNIAKSMHTTAHFKQIARRLNGVLIENRDYQKLILLWLNSEALIYLDPPYCPTTRSSKGYRNEWTAQMHHDLVAFVAPLDGKFIISGYDTDAYMPLIDMGWQKRQYTALTMHAGDGQRKSKIENVWISPLAQETSKNLFTA